MRGIVALLAAFALTGCDSCDSAGDEPGAAPRAADPVDPGNPEETSQPDAAPVQLPLAATATEPVDVSPALGVHDDAVTLDGDLYRLALEDGRLPGDALDDGHIEGLRTVLANLRFAAGGAPGEFRSGLLLLADRSARWQTVRRVAYTAAAEGFVNMKVVARTAEGEEIRRQMRVRAERDDTEPHLRAHLDADGMAIRAPGLGAAMERACGAAPDGPLELAGADAGWDWDTLEECQRAALREITAQTPAAGITAEDDVAWERVVHALDRLRALREDPDRLALLLE